MKLKTYFNAALLCLAAGLLAACAGDELTDGNNKGNTKELPQGVHFTINEPKLKAQTRAVITENGTAAAKTRTIIKHTPGQGAEAYWSEDDRIFVKNKNGDWKRSIATSLLDGGTRALFILPGNEDDYADNCAVAYADFDADNNPEGYRAIDGIISGSTGYMPAVEIKTNQDQTTPNDFSKAGKWGDCGVGTGKKQGGKFEFTLEHSPSYLCLLPRCENAGLGTNIELTNIMIYATSASNNSITSTMFELHEDGTIDYPLGTPSSYGSPSNVVMGTVNNFPLTNTATNPETNACYFVVYPSTYDFAITYTIKDKVTGVEAQIKKQVNGVNCKAGEITDITAWIDKDLKGTHADYYLWGAQKPLTKSIDQLTPGDPQAANVANSIPNTLFSPLPNANELCWYAYKGDVHWGQSLDVYVVNGHLKHINGIWLKKKAKILADEHISASYMENGYPRFDNNQYKDWRNVYWEPGLPAAAYPQFLTIGTTPVPNTQDYFFLPFLGYNYLGFSIMGVDEYVNFWSSSTTSHLGVAWALYIYGHGVKVVSVPKNQSGYLVMPFQ